MSLRPYTWRQAIMRSELPATTRLVLFTISFHITDAGEAACVSTAQLSRESGLSERAVISHVKAIEGEWIGIRRHGFGDQRWARNEYLPRLPGDPSLDVKGTEPASVPSAEIASKGTERDSVPSAPKGTERHDGKALNVVQGDNGFGFSLGPPVVPQSTDLLGDPEAELLAWFDQVFWPKYPLHKARAAALRAMRRLKPNAQLRAAMLAAIERWLDERRQAAERKDFVPVLPHASTWINGKRWEDEPLRIVPRGTEARGEYRCACGKPAVTSSGTRWFCRDCDPLRQGARA